MVLDNATSGQELNTLADFLVVYAAPFVVAITAITGSFVSYITYRFQKKRLRLNALTDAVRMLHDVKHREARKVIYGSANMSSFEIIGLNRPTAEEGADYGELQTICKDIVRSDFNEIGTLIHYGLLEKKIFIEEYYWVILKIWSFLKKEIETRRTTIGPPNYMEHLEEMRKKALEYAKKKYPKVYAEFNTNIEDTNDIPKDKQNGGSSSYAKTEKTI
jgi:hypothetical protein